MCQQCLTPLTAYAGQLSGENYQGRLAAQVASLNSRPKVVVVMTVFNVLLALFVPLLIFIGSLPGHASGNPDDAYQSGMSTAFHSIGAVVVGLVMIPMAGVLIWLATATYTQRTWTWNANFASLAVFVIVQLTKFRLHSTLPHVFAAASLIAVAVVVYFWSRSETRSWFGL